MEITLWKQWEQSTIKDYNDSYPIVGYQKCNLCVKCSDGTINDNYFEKYSIEIFISF